MTVQDLANTLNQQIQTTAQNQSSQISSECVGLIQNLQIALSARMTAAGLNQPLQGVFPLQPSDIAALQTNLSNWLLPNLVAIVTAEAVNHVLPSVQQLPQPS